MSRIFQIYGNDSHDMTLKLLDASNAIELVPSGGNVALKPNLVIAGRPEQGAVTHSGVLSGCIEYFRDNGIKDISIIEGSWLGDETMRAMRTAGYDEVCRKYDVQFHDLKKDSVRRVKTAIGDMEICSRALDSGLLVNLPVLKGHSQTKMTCALKNLKGCLPDKEKRRFHALYFQFKMQFLEDSDDGDADQGKAETIDQVHRTVGQPVGQHNACDVGEAVENVRNHIG